MTAAPRSDRPVVAARPAWKAPNPYSALLADAMQGAGLDVREMARGVGRLPEGPAVLLFHWPDEFFFVRGRKRALRALALAAELAFGRLARGQKVVWLAHNILPHRREGRPFTLGRRLFLSLVDGVVFLSEASRATFAQAYPRLAGLPHVVVAHGDFGPRAIVAAEPPPPPTGPVRAAFIGQVKRYKAPDALARCIAELPRGTAELTVAGSCGDPALAADLARLAAEAPGIRLDLRYLSDEEIERVTDSADVVILPYRDILNSGSALLALSRARPVIAPALGSLVELRGQVGPDWVWLYEGQLTADTLARGLDWVRRTSRPHLPDLSAHDWSGIGEAVARFFRSLLQKR